MNLNRVSNNLIKLIKDLFKDEEDLDIIYLPKSADKHIKTSKAIYVYFDRATFSSSNPKSFLQNKKEISFWITLSGRSAENNGGTFKAQSICYDILNKICNLAGKQTNNISENIELISVDEGTFSNNIYELQLYITIHDNKMRD